jgi:uncharacterized protein DUF4342
VQVPPPIINEDRMTEQKTAAESFKADTAAFADKLRAFIHQGNVRRIVVEHEGRAVAEFPLTAGVIGVVVAPVLAAIGALVALLKDCTIRVERVPESASDVKPPAAADPGSTRVA